jgi:hypothetical protein
LPTSAGKKMMEIEIQTNNYREDNRQRLFSDLSECVDIWKAWSSVFWTTL